ncbi:MAG: ATP-dependent DNA helicase [Chloroflexota bacterium]
MATAGDEDPGQSQLLAGLNPEQRRAVTHDVGPLLVVAGAGTGKTEVITRRIAWLIATRRARPSEILGLTFTDKAAAEMQLRVDQLVPYGFADTTISTFHAFGDRLIREFAFELGMSPDARVLSRAEVIVLLREHLFELGLDAYLPLGDPTRFLGALATLFGRCRDEDVSPADYQAHAEALITSAVSGESDATGRTGDVEALADIAARQGELARAYGRYTVLLATTGVIDFGDQVGLALRLLRASPGTLATVRARYRYVLVDEFQDTNPVQSALVELVADGHRNLFVVGDDDQSIYRFRGAAISNILDFQDRYPNAAAVVLRRNYRSRAPILDAAHRLIRFNDPDRLESRIGISKELVPQRTGSDDVPVRLHGFASSADESDWIAADFRARITAGTRPRDLAILVRANSTADPILRSLNVAGVPWRFAGASGLYARPEVRLLLSVLRFVADPDSSPDLFSIAASEAYRLPPEDLATVMGAARRSNRSAWAVLGAARDGDRSLDISHSGRAAIASLVGDLRRLGDLAQVRPAGEVLYVFLRQSGWLEQLAAADSPVAEATLANIARFFEIVRSRSGLLVDDRAVFLAPHLGTLIEAGDDPSGVDPDPDVDAVTVMTIHKAKGLEFPVVVLPGLVAGRFPSTTRRDPLAMPDALIGGPAPTGDPHLQEERRLFYVAMTRARDELILTHAADYGGVRIRRLSPFVTEALDLPAAVTAGSGAVKPAPIEQLAAFAPAVFVVPQRLTAPIEGPLSLSHSSIDAYLTCPRKFQYSHVLRVPTAPHHSLVYGSALHQVIHEFHRAEARGQVLSEPDLDTALDRAWTNEGFVSREHEQARLAAARSALRAFRAGQLAPDAVVPAWVERDFTFSLDGDRIRGRFDRVDIVTARGASAGSTRRGTTRRGTTRRGTRPELSTPPAPTADVVAPTLELLGREEVTITDYKSSDVRDPAKARQRARESLQLQIYAMAYEALAGRLPDSLQLHFLDSGLVGRTAVDPTRLATARGRIRTAASGIRAREYAARPDTMACTYCPYREICPSSAAT